MFHFDRVFCYCYLRGTCVAFVRMQRNLEVETHDRLDLLDYQVEVEMVCFRLRDPRSSEYNMWV